MNKFVFCLAVLSLSLSLLFGCGQQPDTSSSEDSSPTTSQTTQKTASENETPKKDTQMASAKKTDDNPKVLVKTSMGDITLKLFRDEAPETVANFIGLAEGTKEFTDCNTNEKVKRPYYDGLTFHRVINNFMIQGGCPLGTGSGSPGYTFKDEINAKSLHLEDIQAVSEGQTHEWLLIRSNDDYQRLLQMIIFKEFNIKSEADFKKHEAALQKRFKELHEQIGKMNLEELYSTMGYQYDNTLPESHLPKKGVIAMANIGPNTNGSQFFINLIDTPWLTGKHTVFGEVIKGFDVVEKIGATAVNEKGKPKEDVKIISIRLMN